MNTLPYLCQYSCYLPLLTGKVSEVRFPKAISKSIASEHKTHRTRRLWSYSQSEYEYHSPSRDATHQIMSRRHRRAKTRDPRRDRVRSLTESLCFTANV